MSHVDAKEKLDTIAEHADEKARHETLASAVIQRLVDAILRARPLEFKFDRERVHELAVVMLDFMPQRLKELPLTQEERTHALMVFEMVGRSFLDATEDNTSFTESLLAVVVLLDLLAEGRKFAKLHVIDTDGEDVTDDIFGKVPE